MTVNITALVLEARQLAVDDVLNDPDDTTLLLAVLDSFPETLFDEMSDTEVRTIIRAYDAEVANPTLPIRLDVRG